MFLGALSYGGVQALPGALAASAGTGLAICLGPGIAAGIMLPLGYLLWSKAREAAYLRVNGLPARGIVRSIQATGTRINNVPMMRIVVQVRRDGADPYEASLETLAPPDLLAQLGAGRELPLRVHPQKPAKVILELQ
jgi:hypothetical protein